MVEEKKPNLPSLPTSIRTLVDLLLYRALQTPNQTAYTFLLDGELEEENITYAELDKKARAIAAHIQTFAKPGERVLLLYPPGLEYITAFFGCLYAGVIAVPAYPPRLHRTLARLKAIATDARSHIALTTTSLHSRVESLITQIPEFKDLRSITTDNIDASLSNKWAEFKFQEKQLSFIQYTSGTTGLPKGVALSHENLLNNVSLIYRFFEMNDQSIGMSWLPPYHDMGLIGGVLSPLYAGVPCIFMSPVAFLQKPFRWLQSISRSKATHSGGPSMAYELCLKKITPEQRDTLDLSRWELAFCGADSISCDILKKFTKFFGPCGFNPNALYPCYGLAEATLFVTGGEKGGSLRISSFDQNSLEYQGLAKPASDKVKSWKIVSCGKPKEEQKVRIADPNTHYSCPEEKVGEVWLAGKSIAQGYWDHPEETKEFFQAYLRDTGEGPFFRTGDLGFMKNGELFLIGRLRDAIAAHNRQIFPQVIEESVERSHSSVRNNCSAVFSIEVDRNTELVAVAEFERRNSDNDHHLEHEKNHPINFQEVLQAIYHSVVKNHGIEPYAIVLVKVGSISKTSSGKTQRYACKADYLSNKLEIIAELKTARVQEQQKSFLEAV